MSALARETIKDALFERLSGCHAWQSPSNKIRDTAGLITPTFMLTKFEEQAQYPQVYGPPAWVLSFGMVIDIGPKDNIDTILGEIENALESTASEEKQWQTTLGDLVTWARVESTEIDITEGDPLVRALVTINVAANTKP